MIHRRARKLRDFRVNFLLSIPAPFVNFLTLLRCQGG